MIKRIKAACRTNDPQITAVALFTLLNLIAVLKREGPAPWWAYLLAVGMWPAFAFCMNLINPLPEPKHDD